MITNIKLFKENIYVPKLRLPNENIKYSDYTNVDFNDIELIDLGNDGNNIIHLGVKFPNDQKVNDGIAFDIQMIFGELYHPHLHIAEILKHQGIGFKVVKKFIYDFGHMYVTEARTLNKKEIPVIINKLNSDSNIEHYKTNSAGDLFILSSNPDKDYLFDRYVTNK